jgi:murein DD-endopeptidase MepM/ murein hydrolase activator NlpD
MQKTKGFTFFLCIILVCFLGTEALAQKGKKSKSATAKKPVKSGIKTDAMRIKAPPINYKRSGKGKIKIGYWGKDEVVVSGVMATRYKDNASIRNPNFFENSRRSILSEDTASLMDGEVNIVEVAEEYQIDTTWIKVTEYYSLWDAYNLNPYQADISKFTDTLNVRLYDEEKGQYWSLPLRKTPLTSEFGSRGYRWHYGVDLDLNTGDSVKAVWDGVVRLTNWDGGGYGNYVLVRHYNGLETLYGHLSKITVQVGDIVQAGDLVGKGGSTGRSSGPHLHFEIRFQGVPLNPSDIYNFPEEIIRGQEYVLSPERFRYLAGVTTKYGAIEMDETDLAAFKPARQRKVYYHRVRPGDTLHKLSIKYGVSIATLMKLNGMKKNTTLKAGTRVKLR